MVVDISKEKLQPEGKSARISISFEESANTTIKYKNQNAIAYARQYSAINDNSCGIYNNNPAANLSDCAHFIAHCLKAGGIVVKAAQPNTSICADGLSYRVSELTTALKELDELYSNIKSIGIKDAIVGDLGFFKIPSVRPTHVFMICAPAMNTNDVTIYAHTTNRNCSKPEPEWYQFFDKAYNLVDAE